MSVHPGEVYSRLTVMERAGANHHGHTLWQCLCSCGTEKIVSTPLEQRHNRRKGALA